MLESNLKVRLNHKSSQAPSLLPSHHCDVSRRDMLKSLKLVFILAHNPQWVRVLNPTHLTVILSISTVTLDVRTELLRSHFKLVVGVSEFIIAHIEELIELLVWRCDHYCCWLQIV